jgi:uncharacterized protein YbcV (DUF1398 family)
MDDRQAAVARACLEGAEANTMTFPEIVRTLMQAGFEGYLIDFRKSVATYYTEGGDTLELPARNGGQPVAAMFDVPRVRAAIKEAQDLVPGYSYNGFCRKVIAAGTAGYMVSFSGRRAVYFGRSAETHVEHFPK